MSLQATLVAMTGLDTMLLNSVATVEGSTLVTYNGDYMLLLISYYMENDNTHAFLNMTTLS